MQALLRLAPDGRAPALQKARNLTGEYGDAVRYALEERDVQVGPTAALWVAAARARAPFADAPEVEARHPGLGPDAALAARYAYRIKSTEHRGSYTTASGPKEYHSIVRGLYIDRQPEVPKQIPLDLPTVLWHVTVPGVSAAALRWAALVWPAARESWFASGAFLLAQNLDWWEADWGNRTYLEPLLDPDAHLKPMALLLLALGLAAKPGESGLSADALIQTISDGRLIGTELGETMASLLPTGIVKAGRLAKTLADAARVSPRHSQMVASALERALQHDPSKAPRDLLGLLELLKELLISNGQGLSLEPTRKYLSGLPASGKTGKAAAALLALEGTPP